MIVSEWVAMVISSDDSNFIWSDFDMTLLYVCFWQILMMYACFSQTSHWDRESWCVHNGAFFLRISIISQLMNISNISAQLMNISPREGGIKQPCRLRTMWESSYTELSFFSDPNGSFFNPRPGNGFYFYPDGFFLNPNGSFFDPDGSFF